jgi:hypothetical protein
MASGAVRCERLTDLKGKIISVLSVIIN